MAAQQKVPPPPFNVESLAIFLAVGEEPSRKSRRDLIEAWNEKSESIREAYIRRSKRLMKTWRTP